MVNVPTFLAYNLINLPPLKKENVDCLRVIQELEDMKAQIKYVSSSQLELVNFVKSGKAIKRVSETSFVSSQTDTAHHELPDFTSDLLDDNLGHNPDITPDCATVDADSNTSLVSTMSEEELPYLTSNAVGPMLNVAQERSSVLNTVKVKSRVFTRTDKHLLRDVPKHKPYSYTSYSYALQSQREHNQEYLIGSVVGKKGLQHGHKHSVNANISCQSTTDIQCRESTNVVLTAQMNKAASTSKVCSRVFITCLLLKCTP